MPFRFWLARVLNTLDFFEGGCAGRSRALGIPLVLCQIGVAALPSSYVISAKISDARERGSRPVLEIWIDTGKKSVIYCVLRN